MLFVVAMATWLAKDVGRIPLGSLASLVDHIGQFDLLFLCKFLRVGFHHAFWGNAIVAVQGLAVAMITPGVLAYELLLWVSIPLVVLVISLLAKILRQPDLALERG